MRFPVQLDDTRNFAAIASLAGLLGVWMVAPGCDDITAHSFGGNATETGGVDGALPDGGLARGVGGTIAIGVAPGATGGMPAAAGGPGGGAAPETEGAGGAAGLSTGAAGTGGTTAASGGGGPAAPAGSGGMMSPGNAVGSGGTGAASTGGAPGTIGTGGVKGSGGLPATGGNVGTGGAAVVQGSGGAQGTPAPGSGSGGSSPAGPGATGGGGAKAPDPGGNGQGGDSGGGPVQSPGGGAMCTKLSADYDAAMTKAKACNAKGDAKNVCAMTMPAKLSGCGAACITYVDNNSMLMMIQQQWSKAGCVPAGCNASVCVNLTGASCSGEGDKGTCADTALGL